MNKKDSLRLDDWVICSISGVIGQIIKFYKPTACEEQIMVKTRDERQYHAPKSTWKHYHFGTTVNQMYTDEFATQNLRAQIDTANARPILEFYASKEFEVRVIELKLFSKRR